MEVFAGILIGLAFGFLFGWHARGEAREETVTPIQSAVAYVPIGDCAECAANAVDPEHPELVVARRTLDRHGNCSRCGSSSVSHKSLKLELPSQADVELAIRRAARARAQRATS